MKTEATKKMIKMKAIIGIFSLLIFSIGIKAQTTEEEYRYMQTGYGETLNGGLDIKAGYKVLDDTKSYEGGCNIISRFLVRTKDNSIAGIMLIRTEPKTGTIYMPIPHPKSSPEMIARAFKYFNQSYRYGFYTDYEKNYFQFSFHYIMDNIPLFEKLIKEGATHK